MKIRQYLTEVFLDATKKGGKIYEAYKNPTPIELRNIRESGGYGYRWVIDTATKSFYVTSSEFTHTDMFNHLKEFKADIKNFNFKEYYMKGTDADRIISGHTDKFNFNTLYSDTFTIDFVDEFKGSVEEQFKILENVKKLRNKDFSFMSKWVKPQAITDLIDESIRLIEEELEQ